MEEKRVFIPILLIAIFLITLSGSYANPIVGKSNGKSKPSTPCKQLVFYLHDILFNGKNGANATSSIIAAPEGANLLTLDSFNRFGRAVVFDDPITLDNKLNSPPFGRAQGVYVYDQKNTFHSWLGFTISLNTTDHKGTLVFSGGDPISGNSRDILVVGGTRDFFLTRGIATVTTDGYEGTTYFRLKLDVKLYEC